MASPQEGSSLGGHLRALRASAGGSLADMAVATRISERYLRALESDVPDDLPAPVFVKGFIRAYCAFLGSPADEALALYDQARGASAMGESRTVRVRPGKGWVGHPLAISSALLVIFGVGLVVLKLASQPAPTGLGEPRAAAARAPESAPEMAPPAAPAVSMPPSAAAPAITPARVPETQRLVVKAVEPTWIRVQIDDGRVVEELLKPGAEREWTSDRRFVLTIGNAGGIEVVLNGRPLPSLGARGAVIHRLSLPELPGQGS
jgi:cytoskeleton protein RodZ